MKLPYITCSQSSFEQLRNTGAVYVDKTQQIYELFGRDTFFFIARPRRFGKSLLCSTLAALFKGQKELFKDLWIENSDWEWTEYPIIQLDMTVFSSTANTREKFNFKMVARLKEFALQYGVGDINHTEAGAFLDALIRALYAKTGKKVVVIIDEYDKPMLEVLEEGEDAFDDMRKELREFYAQLKANSDSLRFVLLTGIYKFGQASIFSGLNNIIDLTFNSRAATLLGYTEQELHQYFAPHIEAMAANGCQTTDELMNTLRLQYNGYRFGINFSTGDLGTSVYNPFAMGHVFSLLEPVESWFATGGSESLMKLLRKYDPSNFLPDTLEAPLASFTSSVSKESLSALSILFFAGYLTLTKYDVFEKKVSLDFPNAEVSVALSQLLLPELVYRQRDVVSRASDQLRALLLKNDLSGLQEVLNTILADIPYHIFEKREAYYHLMFYMTLITSRLEVIAEDISSTGRADIVVKAPHITYILELKLGTSAVAAIEQIKERGYHQKYKLDGRKIVLVGVAFDGATRRVVDVRGEAL